MDKYKKINSEEILNLYKELERKDSQIKQLKIRISNLIDNKNELITEINNLKNKNYNLSLNKEKTFIENKILFNKKENELLTLIKNLENENIQLKKSLSEKKNIENNFNNTIQYKLSNAKNQIDNLSILNIKMDNILLYVEKFLENIKVKIKDINPQINFNFRIIGQKCFVDNLKILEKKIINKLDNNSLINKNSNNKESMKKNKKLEQRWKKINKRTINKSRSFSQGLKNYILKTLLNKPKKLKLNNISKNNKKEKIFRSPSNEIKDINDYNDEEISNYLNTINNQRVHSRFLIKSYL